MDVRKLANVESAVASGKTKPTAGTWPNKPEKCPDIDNGRSKLSENGGAESRLKQKNLKVRVQFPLVTEAF